MTFRRVQWFAQHSLLAFGLAVLVPDNVFAQRDKQPAPATVEEAAKVIDFRTWQLPEGFGSPDRVQSCSLHIELKLPFDEVTRKVSQKLKSEGWRDVTIDDFTPIPSYHAQEFEKYGYILTFNVLTLKNGDVNCHLANKGNVNALALPLPPGAEREQGVSHLAMAICTQSAQVTEKFIIKALTDQGWKPYGDGVDAAKKPSKYLKQNAVRIRVTVDPIQKGAKASNIPQPRRLRGAKAPPAPQCLLWYHVDLLPVDLQMPPEVESSKFDEFHEKLTFTTLQTPQEVLKFYRGELIPQGWLLQTDGVGASGEPEVFVKDSQQLTVTGKRAENSSWAYEVQMAKPK